MRPGNRRVAITVRDHVELAGEPTSAGCFVRSVFDWNPGIARAVRAHMANAGEPQVQTVGDKLSAPGTPHT